MSDPVPILFTIPNFITAGSGRAMLNIIERLDRSCYAPAVCVMKKGGALDRVVEGMGIPFIEAPFTVPVRPYVTLASRTRRAAFPFKGHRFALWHSFHYAGDYTEPLIARWAGARAWVYTKKNMSWGDRSWYLRTLLATRVAAQNSDMLRQFFAWGPFARKTCRVPRGVDTHRFRPDVPPTLGLRAQLGIGPERCVAACVAHLVPVKGHPTLLQAVARVPGLSLVIAGKPLDKEYVSSLETLVSELGIGDRVHFVGDVTDVPALLSEVDISVLPTWARWRMEGCPVALLEALSCAKACVATDIPGSRDIVEDGTSGIIVPPEDAAELAHALQELVNRPDLRHGLGDSGRKRVLECFSIEAEVAAHEGLYGSALGISRA